MADEAANPISAILLCTDAHTMPVLVPVLDELKVMKSHYVTSTSAVKALAQNKFDLVVLDLDLAGAQTALDLANAEGTATPVIVLSKEVEVLQAAAQKRVHFLWKKPVSPDLVTRDTKAACGIVKLGANPAYRVPVSIQASANVYVQGTNRALGDVMITNINSGGLCLKSTETPPSDVTVAITFRLPESKATIHATGKVIWKDHQSQVGVHFSFVPPAERAELHRWVAARTPSHAEILNQALAAQTKSSNVSAKSA